MRENTNTSATRAGAAKESRAGIRSGAGFQVWASGWRRVVLATGMLVYPIVTAAGVAVYSTGAASVVGYSILAAFCCLYALAALSTVQRAWTRLWVLLAIMTALFIAALPFTGSYGFYLCAVIVSLAAPRLGRKVFVLVIVAVLVCILVPWLVPAWHSGPGWYQAIALVFTVLTVYAFGEIARANQALVEARAEVARLASEAERNRIARDLHDLVGHSLTAITVKSNLARELAANESSPLLGEVTEIEQLSRQALADMRAAVTGYHEVTLAGELARGKELLRAAGVLPDLPTATDGIAASQQELFGWAVREGITNVVRHAHASVCIVAVSASAVEIRDDGVGGSETAGNGLTGLRERVAAVGGTVEAGPLTPRGWRLRVCLDTAGAR